MASPRRRGSRRDRPSPPRRGSRPPARSPLVPGPIPTPWRRSPSRNDVFHRRQPWLGADRASAHGHGTRPRRTRTARRPARPVDAVPAGAHRLLEVATQLRGLLRDAGDRSRRLRTTLTRARSASDPVGRSRPPRPTARSAPAGERRSPHGPVRRGRCRCRPRRRRPRLAARAGAAGRPAWPARRGPGRGRRRPASRSPGQLDGGHLDARRRQQPSELAAGRCCRPAAPRRAPSGPPTTARPDEWPPSTTTSTDPTAPTATSPPASSPEPGPPDNNQHSRSHWTTQRDPSASASLMCRSRAPDKAARDLYLGPGISARERPLPGARYNHRSVRVGADRVAAHIAQPRAGELERRTGDRPGPGPSPNARQAEPRGPPPNARSRTLNDTPSAITPPTGSSCSPRSGRRCWRRTAPVIFWASPARPDARRPTFS